MVITGIIAEYNPFHKGHEYQIREARRQTGADFIIAIMSGDFVQRGAPACMEKFTRAEAALRSGADLVLELPAAGACASAETFALTGTSILNALGCVDYLCFGCESADPASLDLADRLAHLFTEEPLSYKAALSEHLRSGCTFPEARARAAAAYLSGEDPAAAAAIRAILQNPNDILAIEYRKALIRLSSSIRPWPVMRSGSSYHISSSEKTGLFSEKYSSAEEIRRILFNKGKQSEAFSPDNVPEAAGKLYRNYADQWPFLREDDFSLLLHSALLRPAAQKTSENSSDVELDRRIRSNLEEFSTWSQFITEIKPKNRTYTAVSRRLLAMMLPILPSDTDALRSCGYAPYARILGFRSDAGPLVSQISGTASIPVITSLSEAMSDRSDEAVLPPESRQLLALDLQASSLYGAVLTGLTGRSRPSEFRRKMLRV